ncbi:MAG TPA: cupin domain-containing protein, partial [Solirubrobacteraceae bacterium]|nr:cupin domain-containing protein [Solirubrobacteraceae bacterium]
NPAMQTFNLFKGETGTPPDGTEPPGYLAHAVRLGPKLGASRLGMSIYDLPPGESICPYHFEWTDEEWLIVVSGSPTVRTPDGEVELAPGDVACFAVGPSGAHAVRNGSEEPVRVAMISTRNEFGIAEYPDSDKVGVWAGGTHYMLRRSAHLDYWDGER